MKYFTKKGTKLPVIPKNTQFSTSSSVFTTSNTQYRYGNGELISYGMYNDEYLKCDVPDYIGNNYLLFKLSTIERLAKEQGMCDDKIDLDFIKNWWYMLHGSKTQELRQKYFKNHIGALGIDRLFFIYKSEINNENMKVTLQENGTVTVTDTETTTTLSKVTVDEICRLVKEDRDKVKLEVGKWYHYIGGLYVWNNGNKTYGFNSQKRFDDHYSFATSNGAFEASPETVEQYLKNEFIRLGGKVGAKVECLFAKQIKTIEELKFTYGGSLWIDCGKLSALVFRNGKFATILNPETITRAEAEKRLNNKGEYVNVTD